MDVEIEARLNKYFGVDQSVLVYRLELDDCEVRQYGYADKFEHGTAKLVTNVRADGAKWEYFKRQSSTQPYTYRLIKQENDKFIKFAKEFASKLRSVLILGYGGQYWIGLPWSDLLNDFSCEPLLKLINKFERKQISNTKEGIFKYH
mgnify:FL=1